MGTRARSVQSLASLFVVTSAMGLAARCGKQEEAAPRPTTAIAAERGRAIADEVLVPWMQYHRIPRVSIAVASGDAIDWAKGYGVG